MFLVVKSQELTKGKGKVSIGIICYYRYRSHINETQTQTTDDMNNKFNRKRRHFEVAVSSSSTPKNNDDKNTSTISGVTAKNDVINENANKSGRIIDNDEDKQQQEESLLLLNQLINDDDNDFISVEELHRKEAEKRRMERKKKYASLSLQQEEHQHEKEPAPLPMPPPPLPIPPPPPQQQQQESNLQYSNNDTKNQINIDRHNNNSDDSDYDMFSSSVSPISTSAVLNDSHKISKGLNDDHDTKLSAAKQENQSQPHHSRQQQQDWDDHEGYYKAVIGETIHLTFDSINNQSEVVGNNNQSSGSTTTTITNSSTDTSCSFRITGFIGKGVFSTVLKALTINNSSSIELPPVVALKLIRSNETMSKAAINELHILQKLKNNTSTHSSGIIPLLLPTSSSNNNNNTMISTLQNGIEFRGHTLFVFNHMEYNLRDVLIKFGKNVGLSLQAVRSYYGQLLSALIHLQKHSIIHLDMKPDNILVSNDFSIIQIADFGSAIDIGNDAASGTSSSANNTPAMLLQPTPYLISRFYRAPEIMLGIIPTTYAVDLWSLTVTIIELYLGDVVFKGKSNNDMLYVIQQNLGSFSNRVIKQHIIQCNKYGTNILPNHFRDGHGSGTMNYYFTQQTFDPVTNIPVHKVLLASKTQNNNMNDNNKNNNNINNRFPLATPLHNKIIKSKSAKDSRKMINLFSDLILKCLNLDPMKRIALKDAIRHEFFSSSQQHNNYSNSNSTNDQQQSTAAATDVTK